VALFAGVQVPNPDNVRPYFDVNRKGSVSQRGYLIELPDHVNPSITVEGWTQFPIGKAGRTKWAISACLDGGMCQSVLKLLSVVLMLFYLGIESRQVIDRAGEHIATLVSVIFHRLGRSIKRNNL
jgi:hypothetical protein